MIRPAAICIGAAVFVSACNGLNNSSDVNVDQQNQSSPTISSPVSDYVRVVHPTERTNVQNDLCWRTLESNGWWTIAYVRQDRDIGQDDDGLRKSSLPIIFDSSDGVRLGIVRGVTKYGEPDQMKGVGVLYNRDSLREWNGGQRGYQVIWDFGNGKSLISDPISIDLRKNDQFLDLGGDVDFSDLIIRDQPMFEPVPEREQGYASARRLLDAIETSDRVTISIYRVLMKPEIPDERRRLEEQVGIFRTYVVDLAGYSSIQSVRPTVLQELLDQARSGGCVPGEAGTLPLGR